MIVANLPIELIVEIFKKCDYVTCLKLIRVFKKKINDNKLQNKIIKNKNITQKMNEETTRLTIYLNEIKKQEKKELLSIKRYHRNRFLDNLILKVERNLELMNLQLFENCLVINNKYNTYNTISIEELIHIYEYRLENIKKNRIFFRVQDAILLFHQTCFSEKYNVLMEDFLIDSAVIFTDIMFKSHVDNCICHNIHNWCSGKYCDGCKNCEALYPSLNCLNIKQKETKIFYNQHQ